MTVQTFIITTVPNPAGAGAIYQVDGVNKPVLNLVRGGVYTFVQSAASNTNHPIAFKNSTDAVYTVGVVSSGVPGQAGAKTVITVAATAPANLRYYCVTHGNNMGNIITVTGATAVQTVNIGNQVNDGLGDDLRTAFEKVNANFASLSNSLTITAVNIGTTGQGVAAGSEGNELKFKNLVGGTKITLDGTPNSIVINATQPDAFATIFTPIDSSSISAAVHPEITFEGAGGLEVTSNGSTVTFGLSGAGIPSVSAYDFGPLDGQYTSTASLLLAASNIDFGSVTTPGSLNFNLGSIL